MTKRTFVDKTISEHVKMNNPMAETLAVSAPGPDLDMAGDEVANSESPDMHTQLTQTPAVGLPVTFSPTGKPLGCLCHAATASRAARQRCKIKSTTARSWANGKGVRIVSLKFPLHFPRLHFCRVHECVQERSASLCWLRDRRGLCPQPKSPSSSPMGKFF